MTKRFALIMGFFWLMACIYAAAMWVQRSCVPWAVCAVCAAATSGLFFLAWRTR